MKILLILTLVSMINIWNLSVNRIDLKVLLKIQPVKYPESPSCIDLILTNSLYSFQSFCVIETGLSDFHKMIVSVMRTTFQKLKPRIFQCRDYTQF